VERERIGNREGVEKGRERKKIESEGKINLKQ
jgi:hypothetical protein